MQSLSSPFHNSRLRHGALTCKPRPRFRTTGVCVTLEKRDHIGRFFFDLLLLDVAVVSLGVWVVIVESVDVVELAIGSGVVELAIGSGAVIAGSEVGGVDVLGIAVFGDIAVGAELVGVLGAGVVCASAADESVMAAIAVNVVIRIGSVLLLT